jgi:hypothetical protein
MQKKFLLIISTIIFLIFMVSCSDDSSSEFYYELTEKTTGSNAIKDTAAPDKNDRENQTNSDLKKSNYLDREENMSSENNIISEDITEKDGFIFPGRGTRPYAVMIDNQGKKVLPQGGLLQAQIVYEIVVEGGLSRLMPVFWGIDIDKIGPVRSARHYFLDYAYEYDSVYIHYGWSPFAAKDLKYGKLKYINGMWNAVKMFWDITNDSSNWQDTYTNTEKIYENFERLGYSRKTSFESPFKYYAYQKEPEKGDDAENISISYSKLHHCEYRYDLEAGVYRRYREGKPHMERNSGKQISPMNIIIQKVDNHTIEGDTYDRQDLATTGTGSGYFISRGKAVKINWEKGSRFAKTKFTLENGSELILNTGQTWIQIAPLDTKIKFY